MKNNPSFFYKIELTHLPCSLCLPLNTLTPLWPLLELTFFIAFLFVLAWLAFFWQDFFFRTSCIAFLLDKPEESLSDARLLQRAGQSKEEKNAEQRKTLVSFWGITSTLTRPAYLRRPMDNATSCWQLTNCFSQQKIDQHDLPGTQTRKLSSVSRTHKCL